MWSSSPYDGLIDDLQAEVDRLRLLVAELVYFDLECEGVCFLEQNTDRDLRAEEAWLPALIEKVRREHSG